ncbi:amino acid adenylation domain-containing protein [Nonomuraea angiospora]|uniref:amino acid adenylation domain-containing protein n=1 Tax=Nonomuraea angiospora TaxID=46172 RepID=UPI0037876C32
MTDDPEEFPVSFEQQRIWMAGLADPGSPVMNRSYAFPVRAPDAAAIGRALQRVVARHETLRTSIREVGGTLTQLVHPTVQVDMPEYDVRDRPEPATAARRLVGDLAAEPIATDQVPLWRAAAIRLGSEEWWAAVVTHQIVFDATSAVIFGRELRAYCADPGARLPGPAMSHAGYSASQRDSVRPERVAYWREALAGLPSVHSLPMDRPRPPRMTRTAGEISFEVPPDLLGHVAELALRHSATPFMVFLAGYAALLSRLSGDPEIVVGLTAPGRGRPELSDMIGVFANPVVARLRISDDPSFAELVARVKATVTKAFDHADVPFQAVVEAVAPARDPSVQPLYQIGFDHTPDPGFETVPSRFSQDDLALELTNRDGRLRYRTDLFDPATAETIASRYLRLLREGLDTPDTSIGDLELLDRAELARLTGPEPAARSNTTTALALFEAQAVRTPGAIAVAAGDRSLTYRELDAAASRVAARLRAAGAPKVVGISAEPCLELLPALLGVWKAGGAWLPIDPAYPADRVTYLLRDSGAPLVLAGSESGFPVQVVPNGAQPGGDPVPGTPGEVAYVMYTSGSTGRPKGVVVEHGSLVSYLAWAARAYPGLAGQSLVHSTICFDLTVTGLFGPLIVGGSVRLAPLTAELPRRPSFLKITPSHLPLLEAGGDAAAPDGDLVIGGEALPADALAAWRARNPRTRVTNEYGPTEVTVGCVAVTIEPGEQPPVDAHGGVAIGRPVPGHAAYVLDVRGRPVPDGVPGILHVAGPQVTRGYLGRDSAAYADSPFHPGHRMYATGDLVRRRADGLLEYLGRNDQQIKLRGYRIEPGEIETLLRAQPGIEQAAVTVREDQLVAYVVGPGQPDLGALASQLPEYLVPKSFVRLEALPLTRNGKLDVAALPQPDFSARSGYVAPRTDAEEVVAEIFADLLGVDKIGVEDDFFERGGNSLTSIRAIARLRTRLGVEIPVRGMFAFTTVASLATEVERLVMAELDELSDEEAESLLREGNA